MPVWRQGVPWLAGGFARKGRAAGVTSLTCSITRPARLLAAILNSAQPCPRRDDRYSWHQMNRDSPVDFDRALVEFLDALDRLTHHAGMSIALRGAFCGQV